MGDKTRSKSTPTRTISNFRILGHRAVPNKTGSLAPLDEEELTELKQRTGMTYINPCILSSESSIPILRELLDEARMGHLDLEAVECMDGPVMEQVMSLTQRIQDPTSDTMTNWYMGIDTSAARPLFLMNHLDYLEKEIYPYSRKKDRPVPSSGKQKLRALVTDSVHDTATRIRMMASHEIGHLRFIGLAKELGLPNRLALVDLLEGSAGEDEPANLIRLRTILRHHPRPSFYAYENIEENFAEAYSLWRHQPDKLAPEQTKIFDDLSNSWLD